LLARAGTDQYAVMAVEHPHIMLTKSEREKSASISPIIAIFVEPVAEHYCQLARIPLYFP